MFICASLGFRKFRMLINFNAKFNVVLFFYNCCCFFNMAMSKYQPPGSLSKKRFPLKKKSRSLMLTKREGKVCWQLADQFRIGKTAVAEIIKNEASIRQQYECFKGNLKRNRKQQFYKINEILCCSKSVVRWTFILIEKCWKKKPWKLKNIWTARNF